MYIIKECSNLDGDYVETILYYAETREEANEAVDELNKKLEKNKSETEKKINEFDNTDNSDYYFMAFYLDELRSTTYCYQKVEKYRSEKNWLF